MFESRKIAPKLERRVMLNRMLADASYVMSLLCFELVRFASFPEKDSLVLKAVSFRVTLMTHYATFAAVSA